MPRPKKQTVDYFPHFVYDSKTLFTLENRFGNDGYCFWFKLLEILCKSDGHCYDCSKIADWEYLIAYTRVDDETAIAIMDKLSEMNKIDSELWEGKIVWCESLMDNLKCVYTKRKANAPNKPSAVKSVKKIPKSSKSEVQESIVTEIPPIAEVAENKLKPTKFKKASVLSNVQFERFKQFWEIWPNKVSRGQAESTWEKIDPDDELLKTIIDGVNRSMEQDKRFKDGFTPHAATWLNAKGWADEFSLKKVESKQVKETSQNDFLKHDYDFEKIERKAMEMMLKENGGK